MDVQCTVTGEPTKAQWWNVLDLWNHLLRASAMRSRCFLFGLSHEFLCHILQNPEFSSSFVKKISQSLRDLLKSMKIKKHTFSIKEYIGIFLLAGTQVQERPNSYCHSV